MAKSYREKLPQADGVAEQHNVGLLDTLIADLEKDEEKEECQFNAAGFWETLEYVLTALSLVAKKGMKRKAKELAKELATEKLKSPVNLAEEESEEAAQALKAVEEFEMSEALANTLDREDFGTPDLTAHQEKQLLRNSSIKVHPPLVPDQGYLPPLGPGPRGVTKGGLWVQPKVPVL